TLRVRKDAVRHHLLRSALRLGPLHTRHVADREKRSDRRRRGRHRRTPPPDAAAAELRSTAPVPPGHAGRIAPDFLRSPSHGPPWGGGGSERTKGAVFPFAAAPCYHPRLHRAVIGGFQSGKNLKKGKSYGASRDLSGIIRSVDQRARGHYRARLPHLRRS